MFALFFILGNKKEYLIAFDSSGGSLVESQTITEGGTVVKPTDPTKENYSFIRWEYQNREYDFTTKVTSEMTLIAVWEEVKEEKLYDIEFTLEGVTKKLSLSEITEQALEELGFEEKEGYEIKWYLNNEEYDFTTPLTENISLVGKYVKTTLYTVKFNSDGGTSVASQKVKPNEKVTEPEAITKYGFIFEGWYLNNNKYDFTTPVTKNITLVAKWSEDATIKRYEVSFDSDGGSKVDKQRVIENEKAKAPKEPTREGYKFLGWYLNDKAYDFKTKVTSDLILKAKWEKIIQWTVTFDKNNGSSNETKVVNNGEKVTKPTNPTKSGYKFVAWLYNNEPFDFNTPITKDMTLTANYAQLEQWTVTFDSNGGSSVTSQKVYDGSKATKPTNPTRTDYDFVKWTLNGNEYKFDTAVTKDITLVAEWKAKTYAYKAKAERPGSDSFTYDREIKLYEDNRVISYKSVIIAGRSFSGPNYVINVNTLNDYLNGAKSLKFKIVKDNVEKEITASLEIEQ